jgi:hypothetical protein
MRKVLLSIVAIVAAGIAGLLLYASTQPDTFRIHRSATINAPVERLHGILTDLRRGAEWSPYEKRDPAMKKSYSGPAAGPGARMEWDGNKEVGAGSLTVADASPTRIVVKLDITRPMNANNIVEYTLAPQGNATNVTWALHGPMHLASKVMCLFMDMDKMVGKDFEAGLKDLKTLAER